MLGNEGATAEVENAAEAEAPRTMEETIRETLHSIRDRGDSEPVEAEDEVPETQAEAEPEPETESARPAPNTWRKDVAAKWATLPPEVQAEVERR